MRRVVLGLCLLIIVTACATITTGNDQPVSVNTPGAEGAQCVLTSKQIGTVYLKTPGTVTLKKSKHDIEVKCSKECFNDGAGIIDSKFQGMTAGNLLLGGIVGIMVDSASGAHRKYDKTIDIQMTPIPGCVAGASAVPSAPPPPPPPTAPSAASTPAPSEN
jgi:hypothetical protein